MQKTFHHLVRGIFLKDNKVLLAQAKGFTNSFLPGGHVEFGESARDALIREIKEELGIYCTVGNFLGVVEHKWEKKGILHCEINQVFEVKCNEFHYNSNLESNESNLEFLWCDGADLEEMNLQPYPFRELMYNYLNGNKDVWWESTLNIEIDDSNRN
ncbi:NUDIX domain-containing protein [Gottfriedia sp. S16(2024)]|uniref:NUDIX domain-containing protein n=1 Tax=Gottfriedia sp. S16(2024) TaxID=3162883 RepID=UPI003D1B56CD